jgi:GntR family transcriptional regulator
MVALTAGGMPLHRQLYLVLRDQITRGGLAPGSALPSEQALGDLYDVSRITVRRALQDLSDDHFVIRRHGLGTFVAEGAPDSSRPHPQSVRGALRQAQAETTVEVIELEQRAAPARIAEALKLAPAALATYILRVRSNDRNPLMVTEAWVPTTLSERLTEKQLRRHALYELLEETGVVLGRVTQELSAEIADPVRARLLRVDIGSALLRIERIMHDVGGDPVELLTIYATPERSRVLTDVPAVDIDTAATGFLAHDVEAARVTDA